MAILQAPQFQPPENATEAQWVLSIMEKSGYDLETMKQTIADSIGGGDESRRKTYVHFSSTPLFQKAYRPPRIERIFSAYEDDRMFSVELVGAVCYSYRHCIHCADLVLGHAPGVVRGEDV